MYGHRDYSITLTTPSTADVLAALEAGLDFLPDSVLIGGTRSECAGLLFTVSSPSPSQALTDAAALLVRAGVKVPDGASLSVLEHKAA
jgi:hypothetical protein